MLSSTALQHQPLHPGSLNRALRVILSAWFQVEGVSVRVHTHTHVTPACCLWEPNQQKTTFFFFFEVLSVVQELTQR